MTWKKFRIFRKTDEQSFNCESKISKFEKIKVFKSLPKEEWKPAFNALNEIIGANLKEYGFKKKGRKHYRLTNDLLEIIDVDNRGSWSGTKDTIEIRIGLVPYCWEGLTKEYYLVGSKKIEEIDKTIRKHFRISQEYLLLADYLSERIIRNVLPYFEKYNSTKKITNQPYIFPYQASHLTFDTYNGHLLILFAEIKQHKVNKSIEILDKLIEVSMRFENELELKKWTKIKTLIENNDWNSIDKILTKNELIELNKLKIKPLTNKVT
ncbi:hypothetical protein ACFFVB_08245 [Formosa undariae]|uniref:DUF4304 domain-containing protein n=1 Tax=Formosa undariae TaxID=1325436 RepID=A0ABV5F0U7_9FLAO